MSTTTRIRLAAPSEQAALDALHKRSSYVWEDHRAQLDAHPDALGVPPEAIAEERVRVAVGAGGELLGFSIVAEVERRVCELDDLFVEPDVLRTGIGRSLVEDAVSRARRAGCREMTVIGHPRAIGFYESVGFISGEAASTRFGPAVKMRRAL